MNYYSSQKDSVLCVLCKAPKMWCVCPGICHSCKFYDMSTCRNPKSGNLRLTMHKEDYCDKYEKGKFEDSSKKSV